MSSETTNPNRYVDLHACGDRHDLRMTCLRSTMKPWEQAAREEDEFFAEVRARVPVPKFLTFTRPSRSGGHDHVIHVEGDSLSPIDLDHPCSCPAGSEGRWCWAALEIIANELPNYSQERGVRERAHIARELIAERAKRDRRRTAVRQAQEAR
jgi:hypothetical protein